MKRMKTILAAVLSAAMMLSFAACGSDDGGGTSTGDSSGGSSGNINATVFIYDNSDPYISTVRESLEKDLDAAGIKADFQDAQNTQATQNDQIATAITQQTDLLIVNIVDTGSDDAAQNIVDQAKEANIPIIFFNREVSDDVVNSYDKCAFVGTDPDEAGVMQGEMIADDIKDNFKEIDLNGDGKIQYIMFKGELGNAEADGRTKYSIEQANKDLGDVGQLEYYDANATDLFQACNWKASESQNAMATALNTNPMTGDSPIEMVIANNDDMASGAITALNEVGYNTGSGDFIPVYGVDATSDAKDLIAAGKMSGSIAQSNVNMSAAITGLATSIANGNDLMKDVDDSFLTDVDATLDSGVNKIRIHYFIYTGE